MLHIEFKQRKLASYVVYSQMQYTLFSNLLQCSESKAQTSKATQSGIIGNMEALSEITGGRKEIRVTLLTAASVYFLRWHCLLVCFEYNRLR